MPRRKPPKVPISQTKQKVSTRRITYNVQAIQSLANLPQDIGPSTTRVSQTQREAYIERESRVAPRFPQQRELTAQEFGSLYPQLLAKDPDLLSGLAERGVTFHTDPNLIQNLGAGGIYDPYTRQISVQQGQPGLVAAHEVVHADISTGPLNTARYLFDRNYRATTSEDLFREGNTWPGSFIRRAWFKESAAANPDDPFALLEERRREYSLRGETFAMGAGGSAAYIDYPVDYYDANRLFGGTLDPGYVRTTGGRTAPANRNFGNLQYRYRSYSPIRGR